MCHVKRLVLSLFCLLVACGQVDQAVQFDNVWVRATKPGQEVAAGYLTLTSKQDLSLFKVESEEIGKVEIHSMTMNNGVMEMRMIDEIKLEKGKPTKLAPGGLHLMLFDIKKPLTVGNNIKFKLYFKDAAGVVSTEGISSPILEGEPE